MNSLYALAHLNLPTVGFKSKPAHVFHACNL